jgi:hypothetical protein
MFCAIAASFHQLFPRLVKRQENIAAFQKHQCSKKRKEYGAKSATTLPYGSITIRPW